MIIPGEPPHIRRFRPKRSHASKACRFLLHNAPHDNGFPPIYSRFFQKAGKFIKSACCTFFIAFYVSITVEQLFYALFNEIIRVFHLLRSNRTNYTQLYHELFFRFLRETIFLLSIKPRTALFHKRANTRMAPEKLRITSSISMLPRPVLYCVYSTRHKPISMTTENATAFLSFLQATGKIHAIGMKSRKFPIRFLRTITGDKELFW